MCGIAGCVAFSGFGESHHALMRRMCGLIAHRGPDDEGFHVEGVGGLGHRRLSIIDLSGGKQPMGSEDGQVWLAFNGEIYNYLEIRADLEKRGHRFRTRSDTEVILEGYRAYGPAIAEKLNGMFAYAIWDAPRKRLVLARDRLGKKPLYYSLRGDTLIFASEMKSLLADPSLPREVDPAAVDAFFTFGFVPSPGTILKGIHKLRPGHMLVWEGGDPKVTQYWNVRYEALEGRGEEEWVDAIQELLDDAVRIRLMSEVPLGAFLSGGLDSSLVVGTMRKLMAGGRVQTFTIGFGEQGFSEVEDARRIAKAFGTDHREFEVRPETAILPELAWHLDEPFGDSSAVPTYYVSRMARQAVTVVLSGDGGDEAFAGYNSYGLEARYDRYRAIPSAIRRGLLGPLGRALPVQAAGRSLLIGLGELEKHTSGEKATLYPLIKDKLYSRSLKDKLRGAADPLSAYGYWAPYPKARLSRMQYSDTKLYLPDDILTKVDRMSMANSLETRAPLLDYRLIELAARIPPGLQRKDGRGKYLLRRLAARLLPAEALAKPKQGFAIPQGQWFRSELKALSEEMLGSKRFLERGYFDRAVMGQVLREHARGSRDFGIWIWCLLNFEMWHRLYMDADTRRV